MIKRVELVKQPVCVCEAGYKRQQKPVLRPDSRGSLQTCARLTSLSVSQRRLNENSRLESITTTNLSVFNKIQEYVYIPVKVAYYVMFVCLLNVKSPLPLTILRAKENRGLLSEMKGKGGRENDGVPDAEGG